MSTRHNSYDKSWEEKIYSKGKQINKYPYSDLISVFLNSYRRLCSEQKRSNVKVLELGCGAGNNLLFFAREGFAVYGVDGSVKACDIAKKYLSEQGYPANIQFATFDNLPFEDETFDIVIDREATYCGKLADIKSWWKEAGRTLKKGGIVISFMFSEDDPYCARAKTIPNYAREIERNTYADFSDGPFFDTGTAHYATKEELFDIFYFLDITSISKHKWGIEYDKINTQNMLCEWIVVGVKK